MDVALKKLTPRKIWRFLLKKAGLRPPSSVSSAAPHAGAGYGIDRVLVVNGFGAFVCGWLLAPQARIRAMSLSIGGQTLEGDPRTLITIPRPDLRSVTDDEAAVWTAGFQVLFRGNVNQIVHSGIALQVGLDNEHKMQLKVPEKTVKYCIDSDSLTTVVDLFPSLSNEGYLDDFAEAFAVTTRRRAADLRIVAAATARRLIVVVLPARWDDVFLVAAEVRRSLERLPADVGVVFISSPKHSRMLALDRMRGLMATAHRPVSLVEIGETTYALWALPRVLSQLGATHFWYCASNAIPTRAGWDAASAFFDGRRSGLELFVRDELAMVEPDSLSFTWEADAFQSWAASAPFFLGGHHRDNGLPRDPAPARHAGAIGLLRTSVWKETVRRADERLYEAARARALSVEAKAVSTNERAAERSVEALADPKWSGPASERRIEANP